MDAGGHREEPLTSNRCFTSIALAFTPCKAPTRNVFFEGWLPWGNAPCPLGLLSTNTRGKGLRCGCLREHGTSRSRLADGEEMFTVIAALRVTWGQAGTVQAESRWSLTSFIRCRLSPNEVEDFIYIRRVPSSAFLNSARAARVPGENVLKLSARESSKGSVSVGRDIGQMRHGVLGLPYIPKSPSRSSPSLAVLDSKLPRISRIECSRTMKARTPRRSRSKCMFRERATGLTLVCTMWEPTSKRNDFLRENPGEKTKTNAFWSARTKCSEVFWSRVANGKPALPCHYVTATSCRRSSGSYGSWMRPRPGKLQQSHIS